METISSIVSGGSIDATKRIVADCLVGARMVIGHLDAHRYRTFTVHCMHLKSPQELFQVAVVIGNQSMVKN